MSHRGRRALALVSRVMLGAILLYAGAAKLLSPELLSAKILVMVPQVGARVAIRVVEGVAAIEAFTGFLLLLGQPTPTTGLAVSLLVSFLAWDAWRALSGDTPGCDCVGDLVIAAAWWQVWLKHLVLGCLFTGWLVPRAVERSVPA